MELEFDGSIVHCDEYDPEATDALLAAARCYWSSRDGALAVLPEALQDRLTACTPPPH